MAKFSRPQRPPKFDTLTNPDARAEDTKRHHMVAPFDRAARAMDDKWGIDRLPELVTPELAEKFGDTMAKLNDAIRTGDELAGWVGVGIRAFAALDAEAERLGAQPASREVIEVEVDGIRYGIMRDDAAWPAIKAERPDLVLVTAREAANAVRNKSPLGEVTDKVREHFPDATVTKAVQLPPVDYANGGDPIPF